TRGYIVELPAGFYSEPPRCVGLCANLGTLPNTNYSGFPYSQGFGMIGYRWSSHRSLDFTATYYGPNNAYFRPAFVVLNADAEWGITRNVSAHLTARNITGIYDG